MFSVAVGDSQRTNTKNTQAAFQEREKDEVEFPSSRKKKESSKRGKGKELGTLTYIMEEEEEVFQRRLALMEPPPFL